MRYLILLIPAITFAEINTTGNLIVNPGFDNGTTGWTLSGDAQRIGDCCPGGHDLEFGDNGSIEQSFDLVNDVITQQMLNNGITLNSSVEVQNGEGGVGSWAPNRGGADSFTIRLQIRDLNNNVLSVTTQERTNVTGINGENFTDSVSFTGTGSNIGNINISGSDAAAPANLGGPNVDNISVTMTYDDTVLTAAQTAILNTAFEEIEEVLITTIEPEELFTYEEFIVEEFIPFEEPEIVTEMFSEIYIQEVAIEEINTGVVNVFTLAVPEEIIEISPVAMIETFEELPITPIETFKEIPMEVSYGSQENIEEIATEIQIGEEVIEVSQNQNIETEEIQSQGEISGEELGGRNELESSGNEEGTPQTTGGGVEQEPTEQVAEETETSPESSETVSNSNSTETVVASEEVSNESGGVTEENEINGEGETGTSGNGDAGDETTAGTEENIESGNQSVEESGDERVSPRNNQVISVEEIARKVDETIKRVDQKLVATSIIVAKAMQSSFSVDNYGKVNKDILNQPNINGGNYYETRDYIDTRNIYAQNQNFYSDIMDNRQEQIQQAADEVIRAEEHLRRIRGY